MTIRIRVVNTAHSSVQVQTEKPLVVHELQSRQLQLLGIGDGRS
jgi:hypothetical protein